MASLIRGETLRILLISADEQLRNQVGEALANSRLRGHRLHWVSQPSLAIVRANDLLPHLILLDDNLGGADFIPMVRQLAAAIPVAVIVALIEEGAMIEARQAVLVGARSFVIKPVDAEDLVTTLLQVMAWRSPTPERSQTKLPAGRIVAFCAPKGGTGRTTLAVNTALEIWRQTNESLVLVDADYAAPALDVALNLHSQHNIADLLPKLSRIDDVLISSVLVDHSSGIKVLLAPPPADLSKPLSLLQVQNILVRLKSMFKWVMVDLGLPLDETTFAFLDGADRIIMSVLPEMVGLRNTRLMLDQMSSRGYPEGKVWLVLNRATMRGGVSPTDIEERLRVKVDFTVPDDQPLATHSINRGVPIVISHRRSAVARAINKVVERIAEEAAEEGLLNESNNDFNLNLDDRLIRR
ncbi:MAG: AAA family ATPase [Anaerolineae bacterium]|nr:AAA family ATPase [Anaerolineae bacterium]